MQEERVTITIPKKSYDEISAKIVSGSTEFATVEAFVEFLISEVLGQETPSTMSSEDERIVSKRLKDLGY